MLQLAAERDGELVIVVPISMGTVYERIIGGQYWLRVNVSHEEHHVGQGFWLSKAHVWGLDANVQGARNAPISSIQKVGTHRVTKALIGREPQRHISDQWAFGNFA